MGRGVNFNLEHGASWKNPIFEGALHENDLTNHANFCYNLLRKWRSLRLQKIRTIYLFTFKIWASKYA